jgi:N-acylglucosamine-6-phosphate 2-epimerase
VAIDGTARPRRDGSQLSDQVRAIHAEGASVMADVAGLHDVDGVLAAGVDVIATTLSGYVDPVTPTIGPDIDLVAAITRHTSLPVIAEGRFTTPDQVRAAFDAGAHAVVVGKAITSPTWLTAAFLA